jgi:hypothetical protein
VNSTSPPPSNVVGAPAASTKLARTTYRTSPSGDTPSGTVARTIFAGCASEKIAVEPFGIGVGNGVAAGGFGWARGAHAESAASPNADARAIARARAPLRARTS